ncbi:MAG TPA: cell division protein FtsK [Streptosporangiaceae bacterium]|nr:cell division protein FtsK [Streptosporangiaceae bacterium]
MTRGYQMRRHARRMRRYGLQPMIFMTPNDRFPETAAVVIARLAWRYRSELAPLVLAAVAVLSAWVLHETRPHMWPFIVLTAAVVAAGLGVAGRRVGLATRAERLYAATVTASTGGWLVTATAVGPRRYPLPHALLIGVLVLAVPWWAHRRRRAKVHVERTLAAWPEIAQAVGLAGSRVMSAVVDVWGWRARFALARGQTIHDVITKLPAIESGLGTFRGAVRVYPTPDDRANRFELRVLDTDPHADAITWPGPSVTSITEPIDLGPFEDAMPARVLFLRRHGLFGGVSGSGKSGGLNVLMGNLTACADVVIWAVDLKRGMELGPWASCIDRLATTSAEARALLADAVAILEARAAFLAATGQRVWEPTPDMPALVIIVDEYAELAETAPEATSDADSIARRGRAVAVTLIAATQRPTQKAMGQGALRSQMDVRICFRVRERKDVDLILGQGMLTAGWHAHTLNAPGKFLISAPEHDTPRRARAYLLTDQAVSITASRHAELRPALDEVSVRAVDERANSHSDGQVAGSDGNQAEDSAADPEAILWAALSLAPDQGISVSDLMSATGMSRRWVYYRLRELADAGRAVQTERGNWRATDDAQ